MVLAMKDTCERCHAQLDRQSEAYICSFECTFCQKCAQALHDTCPNCGGELVRRPKQKVTPTNAVLDSDLREPESIPAQCPVVR